MVLGGDEGLECEVCIDRMHRNLNIWNVLDESGKGRAECRKMASGRRVVGSIRSLVNDKDLQLECASLAWNIAWLCSYVWQ